MIDFWTGVLALTIFLYVTLDGFDLGVGMLFIAMPNEASRRHMLASIAPVWDGNETWLILTATILFATFPLAYSTLLSAFYLPLFFMLAALIFRGVAFEFRYKTARYCFLWDLGFTLGSFIAAFMQGTTIGALVVGVRIVDHHYVGGPLDWATPFSFFCGFGLCLGYAMLGAGWLTYKTAKDVQNRAFRLLLPLLIGVMAFLCVALLFAAFLNLQVMRRLLNHPSLLVFPMIGVGAGGVMVRAIARHQQLTPFLCGLTIFASAFATLALCFYPYMIPFSITITDAAAPHSSLAFFFWGAGVFVLPITMAYTLVVYFVFKGKVDTEDVAV